MALWWNYHGTYVIGIWRFLEMGYPQKQKHRCGLILDDLGYPHFRKPPYIYNSTESTQATIMIHNREFMWIWMGRYWNISGKYDIWVCLEMLMQIHIKRQLSWWSSIICGVPSKFSDKTRWTSLNIVMLPSRIGMFHRFLQATPHIFCA